MAQDLEKAIIALAMLDQRVAEMVASVLSEEDFESPAMRAAFAAIKETGASDPFLIASLVDERYRADIFSAAQIGLECLDGASREQLARQYLIALMKERLAKQFSRRLSEIALKVHRTPALLEEAIAEAESVVAEALAQFPAEVEREEWLKQIAEAVCGEKQFLSTGIAKLDWALRSAAPGDLFVVAGRTSVGKTAFAIQSAVSCAINGKRVLYVTLEMRKVEITLRFLSHLGFIPLNWFFGAGSEALATNLASALRAFERLPIKILDPSAHADAFGTPQLALSLQRFSPDIVVIDYLHLMASAKDEGMVEALSELSRELKRLALRFDCLIIGLSQINRTAAPSEADLEQIYYSSALAHAASQVLMLRPTDLVIASPALRIISLALVKNRNGPVLQVESLFIPRLMRFIATEKEVIDGLKKARR